MAFSPTTTMDLFNVLFVTSLLVMTGMRTEVVASTLSIHREPEGPLILTESEDALLTLHISGIDTDFILSAHSASPGTFVVQDNATFHVQVGGGGEEALDINGNGTVDVTIELTGVFIGISELVFTSSNADTHRPLDTDIFSPHIVKVKRKRSVIVDAFTYILAVWLVVSYISMGSTMNWESIWSKLRKPYGVVIGLLCQFVLMPALSFTLAKMLRLSDAAALGLVIIGCCPGGWVSNIYSLLLDCDLTLSITMTMCSTVIALGAMPANLFIYGSHFASEAIDVPYGTATLQIITLVIPVFFGMILYYKVPKVAAILGRLLRVIAMIMILIGVAIGLPANLYAFYAPLEIIFVSLLLPIVGSVLGFFIAKATCLYNVSAVTVALETGAQNSLLGALIGRFAFPQPEGDLISRIPLLCAMFTMGYGALVTVIYVIMTKCPGKIHVPEKNKDACIKCGMVATVENAKPAENGDCSQPDPEAGVTDQQKADPEVRVTEVNEGHTNEAFDKEDKIMTSEFSGKNGASNNGNTNNNNLESTYF